MLSDFGWMKCAISEGMLPDEYAVECKTVDDATVSFFASSGVVDRAKGLLKVRELECKDDYCLVYLPATPFENSSRAVKFKKGLIQKG